MTEPTALPAATPTEPTAPSSAFSPSPSPPPTPHPLPATRLPNPALPATNARAVLVLQRLVAGETAEDVRTDLGLSKREMRALTREAYRGAFSDGLVKAEQWKAQSWAEYEEVKQKLIDAFEASVLSPSKNYPAGDPRFLAIFIKAKEQQDRMAGIHMAKETVQRTQGEETDYREVIRERILTIRRKYSREQVAARAAAADADFTEQEQNGDEQAAQGEEAGRNVDAGRQPGSAPSPTAGGHVAASGGAAGTEGAGGGEGREEGGKA